MSVALTWHCKVQWNWPYNAQIPSFEDGISWRGLLSHFSFFLLLFLPLSTFAKLGGGGTQEPLFYPFIFHNIFLTEYLIVPLPFQEIFFFNFFIFFLLFFSLSFSTFAKAFQLPPQENFELIKWRILMGYRLYDDVMQGDMGAPIVRFHCVFYQLPIGIFYIPFVYSYFILCCSLLFFFYIIQFHVHYLPK